MPILAKCPRCELNYVQPGEKYCKVCQREMKKGLEDRTERTEICPVCGIRPVVPHTELCAQCTREQKRLKAIVTDTYDDSTDDLLNEVDDLDALEELEIISKEEEPLEEEGEEPDTANNGDSE